VLVHKFVCQGTVEEKIDSLIKDKTALSNDLLEGGAETLLTEMDNEVLLQLVSLDIEKNLTQINRERICHSIDGHLMYQSRNGAQKHSAK
jgi:hypothetical protein